MTFYIGVDYYPEQWPRESWENSAAQMQQAGFNIARLAEFSWALLEPEEGRFEFAWLDSAIATLHQHGLAVLLSTPTAAMPAWVKQKYPETLASGDSHHRDAWGMRKNNCFSSGTYRLLSERITRALAEHYAENPAVIGWQTDNEFDGPVCRCETCRREFQVFLRRKYRTVATLNAAWGTTFWSHLFSEWEEIPVAANSQFDNPSLCLDWQRFQTFLQVRFQRDQVNILRQTCPQHFVTHNFMGTVNYSDCFEMSRDLDFASLDSYPGYHDQAAPEPHYAAALSCDLTRGLKNKNFWIMETTAGPIGWGEFTRNLRPGELRKNFYHHVAHGADGQLFFRWRTATAGREQYWHGLLGHDGLPGRRYEEAAQIAGEAHKIAPYLEGTAPDTQVALLYDYDSRWATDIQPGFRGNEYVTALRRPYDALLRAGINVDVVSPQADLSRYRVVIASNLHVLPDTLAEKLNAFVATGGTLLADTRTGVKTETNLCHERRLPGLLSASLGIEIEEYESVPGDYPVIGQGGFEGQWTAQQYADWIRPSGAEALAGYLPWHMSQFAAVTRHVYGLGTGYYVGAIFAEFGFYDRLIAEVLKTAGVRAVLTPPSGVEVCVRVGPARSLLFVINHTEEQKTVTLPRQMREIPSGQSLTGEITLARFGVSIFEIEDLCIPQS